MKNETEDLAKNVEGADGILIVRGAKNSREKERQADNHEGPSLSPCGNPVDERSKNCGRRDNENKVGAFVPMIRAPKSHHRRFRAALRLIRFTNDIQSSSLTVSNQLFEEHIAGRTYQIEVSPVSAERWRAQIVRRPGIQTSLMPFYGKTPEDAARELSNWLSLVSGAAPANT